MSRFKAVFAVLILAAMVSVVPAHAAVQVVAVLAGSSAMWQTMALGAYNAGHCVIGTATCKHFTASNFNLTDTRPVLLGGVSVNDQGNVWVVWDSVATTRVWVYIKVDSVVGNRCYFAHPRCSVNINPFPQTGANLISSAVWGDGSSDSTPPLAVQNLFTRATGLPVSVGATDIRPEDALFAQCRANSVVGGGPDGLDGLGYGINPSGVCPTFGVSPAQLEGRPIQGGSSDANNLAFNISGTDPFSNTAIPGFGTVEVGAASITFITSRSAGLLTVKNGSDTQLKTVFSGEDCNASVFGAPPAPVQAYLREPLSGTMNTTEYTVFRYPREDGTSQEKDVGSTNPLSNTACATGGGGRTRVIGTGAAVNAVKNSVATFGMDGIAYVFFSYGNVNPIASSSTFGYLTLDGVDGIFAKYPGGDPGEPGNGVIPGVVNLPASCNHAFPCSESRIWAGHLSFPNLRNGSYRAWSVLRLVSDGAPGGAINAAKILVAKSNIFVVQSVPDYVPFNPVKSGTTTA